jgi:hypothetical protein
VDTRASPGHGVDVEVEWSIPLIELNVFGRDGIIGLCGQLSGDCRH